MKVHFRSTIAITAPESWFPRASDEGYHMTILRDLRRLPAVLVLSMIGAYVCAFAFVAVFQWTLPPSDLAFVQGLWKTLRDPFVRNTAGGFAAASGLVVFPIAFVALRGRSLLASFAISLTAVLLEILLFTPLLGFGAVPGAFIVLAIALIGCCRSQARILQLR